MEDNKGTIKREIGTISIRKAELTQIIINALLEKGYDLVSKEVLNDEGHMMGEDITIFAKEKRDRYN